MFSENGVLKIDLRYIDTLLKKGGRWPLDQWLIADGSHVKVCTPLFVLTDSVTHLECESFENSIISNLVPVGTKINVDTRIDSFQKEEL